ncbi:hypothetical protein BKA62DRAFT_24271 [Auriculariales sp. MPI-PUGE-AT-0066]|nr:hypothetical protein BKA62DRAFT_24271 [Auriculariales sp. MPI-PUGE-AT-0066]
MPSSSVVTLFFFPISPSLVISPTSFFVLSAEMVKDMSIGAVFGAVGRTVRRPWQIVRRLSKQAANDNTALAKPNPVGATLSRFATTPGGQYTLLQKEADSAPLTRPSLQFTSPRPRSWYDSPHETSNSRRSFVPRYRDSVVADDVGVVARA